MELVDVRESVVTTGGPWEAGLYDAPVLSALANANRAFEASLDPRRQACDYIAHLSVTLSSTGLVSEAALFDVVLLAFGANSLKPTRTLPAIVHIAHAAMLNWIAPPEATSGFTYAALLRHSSM